MALESCRECGRDVSTEAMTCPHCGIATPTAVVPASTTWQGFVVLVVVCVMGMMAVRSCPRDAAPNESAAVATRSTHDARVSAVRWAAQDAVKRLLRDPESATFEELAVVSHGDTMLACGYVNAKNGFGGYVGRQAFVGSTGTAILSSQMAHGEFRKLWQRACVGGRSE